MRTWWALHAPHHCARIPHHAHASHHASVHHITTHVPAHHGVSRRRATTLIKVLHRFADHAVVAALLVGWLARASIMRTWWALHAPHHCARIPHHAHASRHATVHHVTTHASHHAS